jgi:hypothetical protein
MRCAKTVDDPRALIHGAQNPSTIMAALIAMRRGNSIALARMLSSPPRGVYHSTKPGNLPGKTHYSARNASMG